MKLVLKNVRLAFGQGLFTARAANEDGSGDAKFSCKGIMDPTTAHGKANIKMVEDAEVKIATEKWAAKGAAVLKALRADNKAVLKDGDSKEWDGFAGNNFVNASNKLKPKVKDRRGNDAGPEEVYSGCYGDLHVEMWAQDNKFGKRINLTLRGFQKVADGDAFGGGQPASDEEFSDLGDPDSVDGETADADI